MSDQKRTPEEFSPDELEAQEGEPLPDREVMSVIDPGAGRFADAPLQPDGVFGDPNDPKLLRPPA